MDLSYLKEIIRIARRSGVTELEIEENGTKVRLRNESGLRDARATPEFIAAPLLPVPSGPAPAPPAAPPAPPAAPEQDKNIVYIESPIVGTFYRAPSPDAPSFASTGHTVTPDTVVCIIEAMKVMNEIRAGCSGRVVEVLVENANPVEYGQPLFAIRKE